MTELSLPPIHGQLDADIAPLVHALRGAGFPTFCSGDGTGGGWLGVPFVNVAVDGAGPLAVGVMRAILVGWLRSRDLTANVVEVHTTMVGESVFPFIRIEVFSGLSEARL